jgi:hypothetical protein
MRWRGECFSWAAGRQHLVVGAEDDGGNDAERVDVNERQQVWLVGAAEEQRSMPRIAHGKQAEPASAVAMNSGRAGDLLQCLTHRA